MHNSQFGNKIYIILGLLAVVMLAACSSDDLLTGGTTDDLMSLTVDVAEADWHGETVSIDTRAGETMESLRATTGDLPEGYGYGFGLYCEELNYTNTQVTWDHTNSRWNIGEHNYNTYWQRNQTGTLEIYAYAPYNKTGYAVENHMLTFVAEKHNVSDYTNLLSGGNVDLLQAYASHERTNSNPAKLNFQHSLAKLTFGTVTNHTGETIQLEGFTVKGMMYSQAKLNLATGVWSEHDVWPDGVAETEAEVKLPPDFVQVVHNPAEMAGAPPAGYIAKALILPLHDGQTIIPTMQSNSLLLIPGANGEIDVTIEINNSTGETFSFPITLEQGREKIVNITIGRNFEVVIE